MVTRRCGRGEVTEDCDDPHHDGDDDVDDGRIVIKNEVKSVN